MDLGVLVSVAIRLGIIVAVLVMRRQLERARWLAFAGSTLASAVTGLTAVAVLNTGHPFRGLLFVHAASGLSVAYTVDTLSAWFLLVLSLLAIPIALFSIGYGRHAPLNRRSVFLGIAFNVLLSSVELVFVAADVIGFLFAWELMTLATAALVATAHEERATRQAAFLYLIMSHVGTGALTAAFFILAAAARSMTFSTLLTGDVVSGPVRDAVFLLFFFGFGVKAGIIPLHVWLPEAHPAAPSNISALMSGVLIKTGIYGIVRFGAFGLGPPRLSWGVLVLVVGGLSSVLGVLYALMQHDLKRLLAYHSIENIGIILLGIGAGMMAVSSGQPALAAVGVAAGLYHVLNHAVFKGLLFLGAGSVVVATGIRHIEDLGGLLRRMPWTGACFLIGAIAISGLPPLNGFASEWLAFQAFLYAFRSSTEPLVHFLAPVAAALLALTGALAAACFVKAFGITFLGRPRTQVAREAVETDRWSLAAMFALAALCLLAGILPGYFIDALAPVIQALTGAHLPRQEHLDWLTIVPIAQSRSSYNGLLLFFFIALAAGLGAEVIHRWASAATRRSDPWDCGFPDASPVTQYTAGSFSQPIRRVFGTVVFRAREEVHMPPPGDVRAARLHVQLRDVPWEALYAPVARLVSFAADRLNKAQFLTIRGYLTLVFSALVVLLMVLAVWQ